MPLYLEYKYLQLAYFLQIWCAAGVNLTGGKTKDGGSIVGASVFYENPPEAETVKKTDKKDDVDKLDDELQVFIVPRLFEEKRGDIIFGYP